MTAHTPLPPHTPMTRGEAWATVERAWFEHLAEQQRARVAAMSPAHRASFERYSAEVDEAFENYGSEAHDPDREGAFKRGMYPGDAA